MSKIALLIGPSGVGKTTIADYLREQYGMSQIESYTTRPKRFDGEIGHIFVTDQEFDQLHDFVAYTEFDGNRYGATAQQVEDNDIYVVDVAGAEYFSTAYRGDKEPVVFYITASEDELTQRMRLRGDSEDAIARRIENDNRMFADAGLRLKRLYKEVWLVENHEVSQAAAEIIKCLNETEKGIG